MNNNQILEKFRDGQAIDTWYSYDDIITVMNMLREEFIDEKIKEYFAGLNGKETALIVINYLLRGGITDDDLRGLRLQWIKEQPEGVDVWVSVDKVDAVISTGEPERYEQDGANFFCGYGEVIETNVYDFAKLLSIERGECAKFKIVRQP